MLVYSLLFIWPALGSLATSSKSTSFSRISIVIFGFVLFLIIGLRYKIGVDWELYLSNMYSYEYLSWLETLVFDDPAYGLLNRISVSLGYGIWLPNLVCAFVFAFAIIDLLVPSFTSDSRRQYHA